MKLAQGVELNVIATAQFKTVRIAVDLIAPVTVTDLSKRILLAQLLETSSLDYPTQTSLGTALSMMYGANYAVNVFRYGRLNGLRFSATVIDGKLLNQTSLVKDMLAFLQRVIYRPLVHNNAFDTQTFNRQQQNLIAYLKSLEDDKQYYAEQELHQLIYRDEPELATGLYGDPKTVEKLNAADLLADYEKLLATNQIQITVVGDTSEAEIAAQLSTWPLTNRQVALPNPVVTRPVKPFLAKAEEQPLQQSKLNLAYRLPAPYRGKNFYAALVFNGLFGGTPISLLFKNVREKNSLAYYATSSYDSFTEVLSVKTGIDAPNKAIVEAIIEEQLARVQAGDFTQTLFDQVVASLVNARESRLDSARALLNQAVLDALTNQQLTSEEWVARVEAVTPEEVIAVAKQVTLQASYFLKGGA